MPKRGYGNGGLLEAEETNPNKADIQFGRERQRIKGFVWGGQHYRLGDFLCYRQQFLSTKKVKLSVIMNMKGENV